MNSNSTVIWVLKMSLDNIEEVSHDLVWGSRSINEEEVIVGDSSVDEMLLIILLLIEPDDLGHPNALEDISILAWVMAISLPLVSVLNWSHECDEFAWDDPVEVSILDSLIVLVLLDIEGPEVIPSEPDGVLESLQTVE